MKTVIIYISKHGTSERIASRINSYLRASADLINLRKTRYIDLSKYDQVILGSSIHAGQNQKRMKRFCEKNSFELTQKRIGLYIACMEEGEKAKEQLLNSYPEGLREIALAQYVLGGEFIFEKMNFIEKAIIKKISGLDKTVSRIKEHEIEEFASVFDN